MLLQVRTCVYFITRTMSLDDMSIFETPHIFFEITLCTVKATQFWIETTCQKPETTGNSFKNTYHRLKRTEEFCNRFFQNCVYFWSHTVWFRNNMMQSWNNIRKFQITWTRMENNRHQKNHFFRLFQNSYFVRSSHLPSLKRFEQILHHKICYNTIHNWQAQNN